MKIIILSLGILVLLAIGFFVFINLKDQVSVPTNSQTVTLTGIVQSVTANVEYSHVLSGGNKITPITSTKVDLSQYENKSVQVTGQFSGTTLYIDKLTLQ